MKNSRFLMQFFGCLLLGLAALLMTQRTQQTRLEEENRTLRQRVDQLIHLAAENERLSNAVVQAEEAETQSQEQLRELLKLRNEVGSLRRQSRDLEEARRASSETSKPVRPTGGWPDAIRQTVNRGFAAWSEGDFQTAMKILRPIAEQGHPTAQHRVGVMYVFGQGVNQDWTEAVRWFRASAEQGMASSQFSMGLRYLDGQGVEKNSQTAARWFQLSADQGTAEAASVLASLCSRGDGVPADAVEAYKWMTIARGQVEPNHGNIPLEDLARKLTSDQIAEAQRRAKEFVPNPSPEY